MYALELAYERVSVCMHHAYMHVCRSRTSLFDMYVHTTCGCMYELRAYVCMYIILLCGARMHTLLVNVGRYEVSAVMSCGGYVLAVNGCTKCDDFFWCDGV